MKTKAFHAGFGGCFWRRLSLSWLLNSWLIGSPLDYNFSCLARSLDRDFEHHNSIGKTATAHVPASKAVIDDVFAMQLAVIDTKALPGTSNGGDSLLETTLDSFARLVGAAELVNRQANPAFSTAVVIHPGLVVQRFRLTDYICECKIEGRCERDRKTGISHDDKGA